MTQHLVWVWANKALGPEKTLSWVCKSGRSAPHQVSWSECTTKLFLKMSKAAVWKYYMGTTGMNFGCQDPCADCYKSLLSSSQSHSQWLSITYFPTIPMGWDRSRSCHEVTHNVWVADCPPGLSIHTGKPGI